MRRRRQLPVDRLLGEQRLTLEAVERATAGGRYPATVRTIAWHLQPHDQRPGDPWRPTEHAVRERIRVLERRRLVTLQPPLWIWSNATHVRLTPLALDVLEAVRTGRPLPGLPAALEARP